MEHALLGPGTTLLLQMEVDRAETEALIRRARAAGARIVLNLAPAAPLDPAALRMLDLLVVNEHEAEWLAAHLHAAPAELHRALGSTVLRTLGERGARYDGPSGAGTLAAHAVDAVDTTAAGDCFTGVLAASLDRGATLDHAVRRANAAAALCCTRTGSQASLPSAHEIDRLAAR